MILISHRGNINGPISEKENHPDYILQAVGKGYNVEIDVWYKNGEFWLGHDSPQYKTSVEFLKNEKFWCHAKNLKALDKMLEHDIHCFWHQEDDFTLTSRGYIWTYPKQNITPRSIAMCVDENYVNVEGCYGICSDYLETL